MKRLFLFLPLFFLCCQHLTGQTFSSEERKTEIENILNTVINSTYFDSIYNQKRVYLLANELLTENTTLTLKRNKCKVKILNKNQTRKVKQYVVLGDFTLDWNNPIVVRVQLSVFPKTLNMRLEKKKGIWEIVDYMFFEE